MPTEGLPPRRARRSRFLSPRGRGTRPRRELSIAKLARLLARAGLRHPANQSASPETICGKRQPQLGDHAREAVQGARATRGCGRVFSRNQCPDQTQSPWDQYYKLWRAHIVVEKNQQFPKQHRHIAAGFACSHAKKFPPSENESGVTFKTPMIKPCRETLKTRSPIFQILSRIKIETNSNARLFEL